MNMFPHADGRSRSEVQAEPLVKMGNLTRLLLVAGGFLGSEETTDDLGCGWRGYPWRDLGDSGYFGILFENEIADLVGRCGF